MKFIGWLVYWLIGTAIIYFICFFIEDFQQMHFWNAIMRAVLILAAIAWGGFLAWWVNND